MAQVRDYGKLAKDIKDAIGEENIISAAHCATRLRLVLKQSPSAEVTAQITKMPAVIQVVEKGGQYQIVIGTHAKDVYEELTRIMQLDTSQAVEQKGSVLNRVIAAMSAVFAPFVYVLAGAGLLQGCLIIINLFAPEFSQTGTYSVLSFMSWTPFTFLPVLIAVTASKHFRCNTFIALWCCLALVNPDWGSIAGKIAEGESIKFLFFNMAQTTYTSSVLPPLFLVLVLSYLERFVNKYIPDVIKALVTPLICTVIMVPATILIIGPLSDMLASAIATGYNFLYSNVPALAAIVIGGFWQVAVIFGVHWGVTPMILANFSNNGCDSFQAVQTCAVVAQAAACFGVFLKTRSKEMKNVSLSAGLTGIFGITEPAIYGVTLRLKKPFIAGCIAGALGGLATTFFHSMYYVYAGLPGLLTTVNAINTENTMSFPGILVGCGVTIVTAIILVQIIGCDEPVAAEGNTTNAENTEQPKAVPTGEVTIYSPLNGEAKELKEVNDPTFAGGILGQGIAIIPSEGKLYAPFDGKVNLVFDTKHAIGLENAAGAEMLIHIGLETVNLNGKYFTPKVKTGDTVKKGDLLVEFDLNEIKKEYETVTPVLITNADSFSTIESLKTTGVVNVGEEIIKAK
ncbi:MAG: PTS transporter subunit EIIC [Firmicutes bacterium]|jgi:PTS system beta-glucosides-specific IIC component|nr:PTS transporter subunit EIIC [Bacillota bacterium]